MGIVFEADENSVYFRSSLQNNGQYIGGSQRLEAQTNVVITILANILFL